MPQPPAPFSFFASLSQASREGRGFFSTAVPGSAQSAEPEEASMSSPWTTAESTAFRFSFAAFSLPGRFTISVRPRMPAALRDRQPRGVILRLSARMASGMPLVSRSMTLSVASGVTSRGEKPVPPVVSTRGTFSSSAHLTSSASMTVFSSGMIDVYTTVRPCASSMRQTAGPLVSTRSPLDPLSLTVMTAA